MKNNLFHYNSHQGQFILRRIHIKDNSHQEQLISITIQINDNSNGQFLLKDISYQGYARQMHIKDISHQVKYILQDKSLPKTS